MFALGIAPPPYFELSASEVTGKSLDDVPPATTTESSEATAIASSWSASLPPRKVAASTAEPSAAIFTIRPSYRLKADVAGRRGACWGWKAPAVPAGNVVHPEESATRMLSLESKAISAA